MKKEILVDFLRELSDLMYDYDVEFDIESCWNEEVPVFNISMTTGGITEYGLASITKNNITANDIEDMIRKQLPKKPIKDDGKFSMKNYNRGD